MARCQIIYFFLLYFTPLVLQYSIDGNSYLHTISYDMNGSYFLVGAVILSPSPRAYVCNAGDRLELICNISESALQWRLTLKGMSDPTDIFISSTTVVARRGMINTSRITVTRTSKENETPLISMLEINPATKDINGTLNITCMSLGPSTTMATTTVHIINPNNGGYYILYYNYYIITGLSVCEHDNE